MGNLLGKIFRTTKNHDLEEFKMQALGLLDRLYRTALILTQHPADAENLVLDTYVNGWSTYHRLEPDANFDLWIFRILQSVFEGRYKDKAEEEPLVDRDIGVATHASDHSGKRNSNGNRESIENHHELHEDPFIAALVQLPEPYRDVVLYADVGELRSKEIADLFGYSIEIVRALLHRGRVLLAQTLVPCDEDRQDVLHHV